MRWTRMMVVPRSGSQTLRSTITTMNAVVASPPARAPHGLSAAHWIAITGPAAVVCPATVATTDLSPLPASGTVTLNW